ncbi:uncharacterized protein LOC9643117 isoform X2 [Selaginella moellendorffii]|uniref:uncharacterized protein LOC9643117 isoform X2 n=1 Tax=Selaginella moellendorffii TaxID=88036 RepID=UPI000D1C3144|nr:uncharacterized protein LOC9643117 isoform X2 [Selaginella moellendorffii]|eukprot:XP_024543867.1 uncharacterized protein LOC9643117 isoform X2 [Selaginella moellendorffii]
MAGEVRGRILEMKTAFRIRSDMKTLTAIDWALNLLHLFILVCGGLIVIMVPVIQGGSPNFSPGWLLIILGGVTIVAGASGIGRTVGPCFWINIVFNCFAALGSIVYSLASFSNVRITFSLWAQLHSLVAERESGEKFSI